MLRWIPAFKHNRGLGLVGLGSKACPPHKLVSPWRSSPRPQTDCSSCPPQFLRVFCLSVPSLHPVPPSLPSVSPLCLTLHHPLFLSRGALCSPFPLLLGPSLLPPHTSLLALLPFCFSLHYPPSFSALSRLPLLGFLSLHLVPTPWRRNDPQTPPQG